VQRVRETPAEDSQRLVAGVREAIGTHALFRYPEQHGALHASAMLAVWMGLGAVQVHEDLGGTVTVVRSGLGHRHDQAWHTDSTPWRRPNVMSLLGHIHIATGFELPATGLLPIATLESALATDSDALHELRTTHVPWRRNFPDREQLSAPILGIDSPRWVGSVLAELRHELTPPLRRAVDVLEKHLLELPPVEETVQPGQLLMFDNRTNFHRGPQVEQTHERQLVRIKLGGTAD